MEQLVAFKYRIYPTKEQQVKLNQTFGCVRFLWNKLVENFNAYGTHSYRPKLNEKMIKEDPDFLWLREASAASLQQKRIDYQSTLSQFFNKKRKAQIGPLQFKKKHNRQSYRLPNQKFYLDQSKSLIRLEKIGLVPVVLDREVPGDTKYQSVTVSKTILTQRGKPGLFP